MFGLLRRVRPGGTRDENLLVISDVHLGEDILHEGPARLAEYIAAHNRELSGFIAHHRRARPGGRPWHLVVNGDFFDFLKVTVLPEETPEKLSLKERVLALQNTPENVVWKLSRVLEVHRPFFEELAAFLLEGNRVTFLEGNHDAEVYFPEVRATLRCALVELAARAHAGGGGGPLARHALLEAVQFRTWYLAEPGRYHIEHGHLYDPYSTFAYHLAPYDAQTRELLATPMSHKLLLELADVLGDFSTHGVSQRGLFNFIKLSARRGARNLWTLWRAYTGFGLSLLSRSRARRKQAQAAWAEEHKEQLALLEQEAVYDRATLATLDALRAPPAEFSLMPLVRRFYFDRVALGVGAMSSIAASVLLGVRGGFVALACGVGLFLTRHGPPDDLDDKLEAAAARIAALTAAPVVVFGHSHNPGLVDVGGAAYINSGCWVTREIIRGAHGHGMSYVELVGSAARLKRWLGEGQEPALLASAAPKLAPAPAAALSPRL